MYREILLLNEMPAARDLLIAECTAADVKLFARSLASLADAALLRKMASDSDASKAAWAISASVYLGGLTGFATDLSPHLRELDGEVIAVAVDAFAECVLKYEDSVALTFMKQVEDEAFLKDCPSLVRFDVENAMQRINDAFGDETQATILRKPWDGSFFVRELLRILNSSSATLSPNWTVWQFKHFLDTPTDQLLLEDIQKLPAYCVAAGYVSEMFGGWIADIERLIYLDNTRSTSQVAAGRLLNLAAAHGLRGDVDFMRMARRIDSAWHDSTAVSALHDWVQACRSDGGGSR